MGNPSSFVEAASVKDVNTFEQAQTFSSGITVWAPSSMVDWW